MRPQTEFEIDKHFRSTQLAKRMEGKTKEYMKEYDEGKGIFVSSVLPYLSIPKLRDAFREGEPSFSVTLNRDIRFYTTGLFKGTTLSDGLLEAIHSWVDRYAKEYVLDIEYNGTSIEIPKYIEIFGVKFKKKPEIKIVTQITFNFKEI